MIPPLTYYEAQIEDKQCKRCKIPLGGLPIQHYDHEGGYDVFTYYQKQWLYVVCPLCDYQWSLTKLGVRRPVTVQFADLPIENGVRKFDYVMLWDKVIISMQEVRDSNWEAQSAEMGQRGVKLNAYLLRAAAAGTNAFTCDEFSIQFVPMP